MTDTGFKTIIKVIAKGSWLTDLEVAERAKMKLDAALYYLRRLTALGSGDKRMGSRTAGLGCS